MNATANRRTVARSTFVVLSCVFLVGGEGCIPPFALPQLYMIEDADGIWHRGTIDEGLTGTWYKANPKEKDDREDGAIKLKQQGKDLVLNVQTEPEDGIKVRVDAYRVRTLKLGKHTLMMWKPAGVVLEYAKKKGHYRKSQLYIVMLYTIEKDVLRWYMLKSEALDKTAKDPRWKEALEITRTELKKKDGEAPVAVVSVRVPRLNAKAVEMIAWLAGDLDNWQTDEELTLSRKPPAKKAE